MYVVSKKECVKIVCWVKRKQFGVNPVILSPCWYKEIGILCLGRMRACWNVWSWRALKFHYCFGQLRRISILLIKFNHRLRRQMSGVATRTSCHMANDCQILRRHRKTWLILSRIMALQFHGNETGITLCMCLANERRRYNVACIEWSLFFGFFRAG